MTENESDISTTTSYKQKIEADVSENEADISTTSYYNIKKPRRNSDKRRLDLLTKTLTSQVRFGVSERTLFHALLPLSPTHPKDENSLDIVFRLSMKGLVDDINNYDPTKETTEENTKFSAGYLELRLLQRIRNHYTEGFHVDIIELLSCPDETRISKFIKNSKCEKYLQKLIDRYDLKNHNIDKIIAEPMTRRLMKISGDRKVQSAANVRICSAMVDGKVMVKFFLENAAIIKTMMRKSELMAWICLGVSAIIPYRTCGFLNTCISYHMIDNKPFEEADPEICWNVPLAYLCKSVQQ